VIEEGDFTHLPSARSFAVCPLRATCPPDADGVLRALPERQRRP
jgi:hypothetical protein